MGGFPLMQRHSQTKNFKSFLYPKKPNSQNRTEKASQNKPDGCIYRDTNESKTVDKYA